MREKRPVRRKGDERTVGSKEGGNETIERNLEPEEIGMLKSERE